MTESRNAAPDTAACALGYGQRRTYLVAATLGGFCVLGSGSVWALCSALLGVSAESGLTMMAVGAALLGIGWLLTLGLRFSTKAPKPLHDAKKVELNLRINVIAMWILLGLVGGACLALIVFAPNGMRPETTALLLSIIAFPAVLLGGVLYIRRIMGNRNELYGRWLAKRHR